MDLYFIFLTFIKYFFLVFNFLPQNLISGTLSVAFTRANCARFPIELLRFEMGFLAAQAQQSSPCRFGMHASLPHVVRHRQSSGFPAGIVRQQTPVRQTGLRFRRVAGQTETESSLFPGLRRSLNICPAVGCRLRMWQRFSTLSEKPRKQFMACQGCSSFARPGTAAGCKWRSRKSASWFGSAEPAE